MKIVPRREVERRWTAYRTRKIERARQKHENRVRGLDLVLRLEDGRKYEFRGRHYGVPPVPWPLAVRIIELQERFALLQTNPDASAWPALFSEVARIFKQATRPEGVVRRLLWPFTPSPLRNAPPVEVGKALGFFCACLTLDAMWSKGAAEHQENLRSLSTSGSGTSSPRSPSGVTKGVRAPGTTSSRAS